MPVSVAQALIIRNAGMSLLASAERRDSFPSIAICWAGRSGNVALTQARKRDSSTSGRKVQEHDQSCHEMEHHLEASETFGTRQASLLRPQRFLWVHLPRK